MQHPTGPKHTDNFFVSKSKVKIRKSIKIINPRKKVPIKRSYHSRKFIVYLLSMLRKLLRNPVATTQRHQRSFVIAKRQLNSSSVSSIFTNANVPLFNVHAFLVYSRECYYHPVLIYHSKMIKCQKRPNFSWKCEHKRTMVLQIVGINIVQNIRLVFVSCLSDMAFIAGFLFSTCWDTFNRVCKWFGFFPRRFNRDLSYFSVIYPGR